MLARTVRNSTPLNLLDLGQCPLPLDPGRRGYPAPRLIRLCPYVNFNACYLTRHLHFGNVRCMASISRHKDNSNTCHESQHKVSFKEHRIIAGKAWHRTLVCPHLSWSDLYHLDSVIQVDAWVTAMHMLMPTPADGLAAFLAVGDKDGSLYLFQPDGRVALEYNSGNCCAFLHMTF